MDDLIAKLTAQLAKTEVKEQKEGSSWTVSLIISLLSVIIVSVLALKSWMDGREKAQLLHEKDVLEEEKRQEAANYLLSSKHEIKEAASRNVDTISKDLKLIEDRLAELTRKKALRTARFAAVRSWRDVDKITGD